MLKRKKTGELDLFKEIWEERPHKSEISNTPIPFFHPQHFAHILPKSAYPRYRLEKQNIILLTREEHFRFDHETHIAKASAMYDHLFRKRAALKFAYYNP